MSESTARAERYEPQHAPSPFYKWEVAKKPVSVQIPFPIIDRLEHEAVESFRSLSSKGSEIGGLLYGTVTPGEPIIVTLDDYELIACDYSRGPLYRLSDADSGRFEKAIQLHGAPGALAVVGLFRSHTRKGLALDAEDLAFFDSRFRDAHHIALLIRPFATKASTGGIFIREAGVVHGETSYLEFPFRSSQLASGKSGTETSEPGPMGMNGGMPSPAAPRTAARAQIVPIASRREVPSSVPPLAVEPVAQVSQAVEAPEEHKPVAAPVVEAKAPVETKPVEPKIETKVEPKVEPKIEAKVEPPKPAAPKETPKAPAAKETPKAPVAKETPKPTSSSKEVTKSAAKVDEKPEKLARKEMAVAVSAPVVEPVADAKSGNMLKIVLGALAAVVLLVTLFVYPGFLRHGKSPSPQGQDASQLSLRVERSGGEILLTWNRDSDVIKNAVHAVLAINDGDQHENVDMDLSQLRNGSISYSPATADVVFKMEVTGKGDVKTASESVRALRTRPSPVTPDTTPQPAAQTPGKPPVPGATPPAATPNAPANGQTPATASSQPAATAPAAAEETATKAPERVLRPFRAEPLSQRLHPVATADLPDAPSLGGVGSASAPNLSALNLNSVSSPIAPPTPVSPSKSAPAPATKAPATTNAATSGGQIVPAQLLRRKEPEYPKLARETGAKGTVELVATIGADGKVKSVKVVHGPPMLVKAASDAVMQWLYRPTMLNGVPVEAQTQVFVNFLGGDR